MNQATTLFVSTFTTLLAIINPLEALPVFLRLLQDKDRRTHRLVARRACTYATLLLFFFLIFSTLLPEIFVVPLSMVRIVGGIILMRIGFSLFMPSGANSTIASATDGGEGDVAFVPLAMPLMFGCGAIATVLGTASLVRHPFTDVPSLFAIVAAILATMGSTYLFPAYADTILGRIGPRGTDAATRIVGFFVAAMGMGLIFHGVTEAIRNYVLSGAH
jgi:multiple antibiotic resistance protein